MLYFTIKWWNCMQMRKIAVYMVCKRHIRHGFDRHEAGAAIGAASPERDG